MHIWNRKRAVQKQDARGVGVSFAMVGLGNPGRQYENTRHNVGFMALDLIAAKQGTQIKRVKFKGLTGTCTIAGQQVLLLKPETFMNLSGQSVTEMMHFYKLTPEQVLLIFDDISLPPGKIRVRRKGSDGGHNGVKNIIYLSGSDAFPRVKIGVGAKPHPEYDLAKWVLSSFSSGERDAVQEALDHAQAAAVQICSGDMDGAMCAYN